jgi:hypothetical protein
VSIGFLFEQGKVDYLAILVAETIAGKVHGRRSNDMRRLSTRVRHFNEMVDTAYRCWE